MELLQIVQIVIVIFFVLEAQADDWDYSSGSHGPSHWGGLCNSGTRQSPININIDTSGTTTDLTLGKFNFINYDKPNKYNILKNTGHTVQVDIRTKDVIISGGGLADVGYILTQFHLHWGTTSVTGSEHTFNGRGFPMEVHFVHFNKAYGDIPLAATQPNGLAVLGFMFNVSSSDNPALNFLVNELANVAYEDQTRNLSSSPPIDTIIGNVNRTRYLRYYGSLTTPPECYESVQWTLFTDKIPISEAQLKKIRDIRADKAGTPIGFNNRPLQSVNGRKIKITYDPGVSMVPLVFHNIVLFAFSINLSLLHQCCFCCLH